MNAKNTTFSYGTGGAWVFSEHKRISSYYRIISRWGGDIFPCSIVKNYLDDLYYRSIVAFFIEQIPSRQKTDL